MAAWIALAGSFGVARGAADAPPLTPQAALQRLFTTDHVNADWFAQSFLQQVSAAQVDTIIGQLKAQLGAFHSIDREGAKFRVSFEHGDDVATIALDSSGRISGLFFETPQPHASNFQGAFDAFKDLPGHTSVFVEEGGKQRAALSADAILAVGSSFKLAVLNALNRQIDAGTTSWQSVVRLQAQHKSLPSGMLQTWPDGAPLTVYSLAALMISQSDNTAADTMLLYAGRGNVERFGPHNRPFLTTREAFVLKDHQNAGMLERYRAAGESQRRALLRQIDALPLPDAGMFGGDPLALDIEWFFSARELCGLMRNVQSMPMMTINPGLADPADWRHVAYKGGSEPGVLNLTTWLVAKGGQSYCVSATWNNANKALDETKFFGLYKSLLSVLST
ncbi:MAG: serine hydrolase [Candidatus Eremiobacteraeota bacterium]|nr:serine hydrolase [Candidatus Eremiobacteraeota bacterium]